MSLYVSGSQAQEVQKLPFPAENVADTCGFLPELATHLATVQTTQDEEVEEKQQQLLQLKVYFLKLHYGIFYSHFPFIACRLN